MAENVPLDQQEREKLESEATLLIVIRQSLVSAATIAATHIHTYRPDLLSLDPKQYFFHSPQDTLDAVFQVVALRYVVRKHHPAHDYDWKLYNQVITVLEDATVPTVPLALSNAILRVSHPEKTMTYTLSAMRNGIPTLQERSIALQDDPMEPFLLEQRHLFDFGDLICEAVWTENGTHLHFYRREALLDTQFNLEKRDVQDHIVVNTTFGAVDEICIHEMPGGVLYRYAKGNRRNIRFFQTEGLSSRARHIGTLSMTQHEHDKFMFWLAEYEHVYEDMSRRVAIRAFPFTIDFEEMFLVLQKELGITSE